MAWVVILSCLAVAITTGTLLGAAIGGTGLILLEFSPGGSTVLAHPAVWNVFTDFTLTAVPMFIFLGEILSVSGLSKSLYKALSPLFERVPGGLLQSNVWVCASLGAVSGSSSATAAAVGSVAYPSLTRLGYDKSFTFASLAGSGTLGLLIPPSLALLIYGATQEVSIGKLFLAGIIPGLMIAGMFTLYIGFRTAANPSLLPVKQEYTPWPEVLRRLSGAWPLIVLIAAVLGTIYAGLATPTEAAAIGVGCAIIMVFFSHETPVRVIYKAFFEGVQIFGILSFLIIGTLVLAQAVSILGLPRELINAVDAINANKYVVLIIVVIIYLILGCFFDGLSLMIVTLPLVFPMMTELGFDEVWLGIIITLLIEIAAITPPVGINLYVLMAITGKDINLVTAARATLPFWLILLGGILILTLVPQIALYLPETFN